MPVIGLSETARQAFLVMLASPDLAAKGRDCRMATVRRREGFGKVWATCLAYGLVERVVPGPGGNLTPEDQLAYDDGYWYKLTPLGVAASWTGQYDLNWKKGVPEEEQRRILRDVAKGARDLVNAVGNVLREWDAARPRKAVKS
jgi:hypothetical protein